MPGSCSRSPASGVSRMRGRTPPVARLGSPQPPTCTMRPIEPEAMAIPANVALLRIVHRNLHAEGYAVGKRFVVLPGADYCYETKSGLSDDNKSRREALEPVSYTHLTL